MNGVMKGYFSPSQAELKTEYVYLENDDYYNIFPKLDTVKNRCFKNQSSDVHAVYK